MIIERVALIYDDGERPETTGGYCRRALEQSVHVEHFRPSQLDRISSDKFDLYLNIDDGMRYRLPPELRPCAWWAIDTHLDFAWYAAKAPDFDYVFTAQRDGPSNSGLRTFRAPPGCPWRATLPYTVCAKSRSALT